jgi:hypothetical protein
MDTLLTPTLNLKLIAAIFVMVTVFNRSMRGRLLWVLAAAAYIAAMVMHICIEGPDGLLSAGSGTALAFVLTLPLKKFERASFEDIVIACVIGGMIGAVAYALAYAIALAVLGVQLCCRAETSYRFDWFFTSGASAGANVTLRDERSALAEIEAKRILYREYSARRDLNIDHIRTGYLPIQWKNAFMTWREKTALAVFVVMMAGFV